MGAAASGGGWLMRVSGFVGGGARRRLPRAGYAKAKSPGVGRRAVLVSDDSYAESDGRCR